MTTKKQSEEILGYECRHVVFCPPPEPGGRDLHVIKEIIHYKDGTSKPNLRFVYDYKRPVWVTKEGFRNHEQKKEWEKIERLNVYQTTQTNLVRTAARALGQPFFRGSLKQLAQSPYLYGADILSTAIIKRSYQDKFPELNTPYKMATFDIETNVTAPRDTREYGSVLMATTTLGSKVVTVIDKAAVAGHINIEAEIRKINDRYLKQLDEEREIDWDIRFVDGEVAVVTECLRQVHAWEPDFLAIWNINFDIPHVAQRLKLNGVDPKDVFSDPRVPEEYRYFNYVEGPSQKVTDSGKMMPMKPAERWHTLYVPASFYVIDAMCTYYHIRNQMPKEQSYSLDAILGKELEKGKLYMEGLTNVSAGTLEWHQVMQGQFPLHYVVYNKYDCVGMQELDEKINDLSLTIAMFSGCSDFRHFRSQPRRMADDLHYFCLQNGLVMATTAKEMKTEFDAMTPSNSGWIVALPAELVVDNGLKIIKGMPHLRTNFRGHVGDLDVSASYPNGEEVMNISKETTKRELIEIEGVPDQIRRMEGINFSGGHTNAVEFCTMLFGMPTMDTWLEAFEQHIEGREIVVTRENLHAAVPIEHLKDEDEELEA